MDVEEKALKIKFKRLEHGQDLPLPFYQSKGAAGMDLYAATTNLNPLTIYPGHMMIVPCGFAIQIPDGYEAQIRPRSGLAFKHAVTICNAPGTIDSDYRGEMKVNLINLGHKEWTFRRGERIAQMIFAPVTRAILTEVDELDDSERGENGFGSTGV